MKFPLARFESFCSELTIDSKERGQLLLTQDNQLSTQKYFTEEIAKGLDEDVHFFVILKGRQEGITTICGALDLFWHYEYEGMQGTFAAHEEMARDKFRAMLTMYHEGLPKTHRIKLLANNRYFLSWQNRSMLSMQIGGGVKKKGGKGRGAGYTFIHATEVSSWEDQESLASILASLAQQNPQRLQIFESTARGMNMFKDIWDDANEAVTQRAIFIGWWRNELYRKEKGSPEYRVYAGPPTSPEAEWIRDVKNLYDFEITSEQLAWWRWENAEIIHDDMLMMQEFPPHAELAFILSGKNFFSVTKVKEIRDAIALEAPGRSYRFQFGDDLLKTQVEETIPRLAQYTEWEAPSDEGYYMIGADCAYGSSPQADRSVVEVYRCYADRFEQVAEFCTPEITTYKFAWVICALGGYYRNSMVNVEINGPGEAVIGEIENVRRQASSMGSSPEGKALRDVVGHMKRFLYRRLDTPFGGLVYDWKTNVDSKDRAFNEFRSIVEKGHGVIHSAGLADEMKVIVRKEGGELEASGSGKDDRVMASAIAAQCYVRFFYVKLKQMQVTWDKERAKRVKVETVGHPETPQEAAVARSVGTYLSSIGIKYGAGT